MSESERTLVRHEPKQGRRPSVAEMRTRIGTLEAELTAAHKCEAAIGLRTLPLDGGGLGWGWVVEEGEW